VNDIAQRAPWTALVLSGGGARGAYEAGVIRYLRDELPPRVRAHLRFEIYCGTSVGAINSCALAAYNHMPEAQGKVLTDLWQRLRIDGVYHVGFRELFSLPKFLFGSRGRGEIDDPVGPGRLGGLFNTSPLEQLVRKSFPWENISANIASGELKALAVNATHVSTGVTHVFVQRKDGKVPSWSTDPQIHPFATEITPNHAMASAAIPWVFPSVEINGEIYFDGGVKLNTPISPAIRLGADRLFVIGLRSGIDAHTTIPKPTRIEHYPSAIFLLGKILNALMVDKTDYDLKRLERFNAMIELGEKVNEKMTSMRGEPYRKIDTFVISPSEDLAEIAGRHLRTGTAATRAGGFFAPFLQRYGESSEGEANDLLSYLLFDGEFASDLIRLGMRDADAQRQKLIDFFSV
jgi:NTE family protein